MPFEQPASIGVSAAARQMKVTLDQVYRLLRAGKVAAEKRDGKWEINQASLASYLASRKRRGT